MYKKNKQNYTGMFLDVDGTLIASEQSERKIKVSKKVKDSIIKAKQKISVGVASGRPLERVSSIFDELGLKQPCVINGGAQIVNPVSHEIIWERPILPKDLKQITSTIKNLTNEVFIVDNGKEKRFKKNLIIKKPLSFFIPQIEETKANTIIKKLSKQKSLALTKIVAYRKGCVALQINHAEATKKHAVMKAIEILKMNYRDIIGVGDGYNDFALFMACGFKVAIGNAVPELKKMADYIAPSVSEDGVAEILEKFIF